MQALSHIRVLEVLCRATKKWGMFISIDDGGVDAIEFFNEVYQAAPYLACHEDDDEYMQILKDCKGVFLFDTETEMEKHYWQTIGDDGASETNPYNGPARVYAITCDNTGQIINENT